MTIIEYFRTLWLRPGQEDRRTGKTTRKVDQLVQELFTKGSVTVTIDYPQDHLWKVFSARLHNEHASTMKYVIFDKRRATVRLMTREEYEKANPKTEN